MPTGYTAGILDGKIKNFTQFATDCMRNFGACIHLRDSNGPYTPREPSDYYLKSLQEANKKMDRLAVTSDNQLVENRKKELEEELVRYEGYIKEKEEHLRRINDILKDARAYVPPTDEHVEIKKFMIQQLTSTIDFDCDPKYYTNHIAEIKADLKNLDPVALRRSLNEGTAKDIAYYSEEYAKELKRCNDSNKWVEDFINSLPKEEKEEEIL